MGGVELCLRLYGSVGVSEYGSEEEMRRECDA